VLKVIGRTADAPPRLVGATTAAIGLLAAVGVARLRRTRIGAQMVASRDDPQRAPWLGADLLTTRVVALALSTGLAGLAGGLYFASSPIGLTAGGVEGFRSLDLLSVTVIGGLGSPVGAFLGAAAVRAARVLLPGTWSALLSGAGVLIVVIFAPAGMSRVLVRARDIGVRLVTPRARQDEQPRDRTEVAA
jgi:branched-chain amino acid transport system permease protein